MKLPVSNAFPVKRFAQRPVTDNSEVEPERTWNVLSLVFNTQEGKDPEFFSAKHRTGKIRNLKYLWNLEKFRTLPLYIGSRTWKKSELSHLWT